LDILIYENDNETGPRHQRKVRLSGESIEDLFDAFFQEIRADAEAVRLPQITACRILFPDEEGFWRCDCPQDLGKAIEHYRRFNNPDFQLLANCGAGQQEKKDTLAWKTAQKVLEEGQTKTASGDSFIDEDVIRGAFSHHLGAICGEYARLKILLTEDQYFVEEVRNEGLKLLSILILTNLDSWSTVFADLWERGWRDHELPFSPLKKPYFCEKPHFEAICEKQWKVLAIEITPLNRTSATEEAVYQHKQILPFKTKVELGNGGFGEVFEIELSPNHRSIYYQSEWNVSFRDICRTVRIKRGLTLKKERLQRWEKNDKPPLALKQLRRSHIAKAREEFDRERSVLTRLARLNHPHIIELVSAFKHGPTYCLLFPLACGSLKKGFEKNHVGDASYMLWMIGQLCGIADGLNAIHTKTQGSYNQGPDDSNPPDQPVQNLDPKSNLKGYHNDLSPTNLFLFVALREPLKGDERNYGRIQIADFGLSKLRNKIDGSVSETIAGQETYAPPESWGKVGSDRVTSRRKDIWSFGCIILEIFVWLLEGPEGTKDFATKRFISAVVFNR